MTAADPCPRCAATDPDPCRTPGGRVLKVDHVGRVRGEVPAPIAVVRAMQAKAAVKADAAQRGKRTALQGLLIDVGVAIAAALLAWLPDADISSRTAWIIFGTAVAKTVLTAVASYAMRLTVAPS